MECDRYQLLLIDVACGEPHSPALAEARLHADTCPSCGPQLRKLEQGIQVAASLSLAEPPQRVSDHVMQRARAHVLAASALNPQTSRANETEPSLADRIREFLIQFAMGRQVAMATVMVLVVAVGLWFVPKARHHELAGGNIVNPDPEGEAGPSDGIVPAAPLDLDLRQGRIRTRGENPEPTAAKEIAAASPVPTADEGAAAVAPEEPTAEKSAAAVALVPDDVMLGASDAIEARDRESAPLAEADVAEAETERKGRSRAPSAEVASAHDEIAGGSEAFAQAAPAIAPTPAPARRSAAREISAEDTYLGFAPPPAAPPAPTTASNRGATAGAGMASLGESVAADSATSEARKSADSLALARDAKQRGHCAEAVTHYETFLRTAPRNRTAMLEAAACYRQLGRQADAARWTTRAGAIASSTVPKSAVQKTEPTAPATAQ